MAENGREGLGEVLNPLLTAQPADVANERGAVMKWGGDPEGLEIKEVAVGDEDFAVILIQVPARYQIP